MPSAAAFAPLSVVMIGVPVIAARVGALEETVASGETGALIAPNDRRELKDALLKYLSDPAEARRQGNHNLGSGWAHGGMGE